MLAGLFGGSGTLAGGAGVAYLGLSSGGDAFFVHQTSSAAFAANLPASHSVGASAGFAPAAYGLFAAANPLSGFGGFLNTTG